MTTLYTKSPQKSTKKICLISNFNLQECNVIKLKSKNENPLHQKDVGGYFITFYWISLQI